MVENKARRWIHFAVFVIPALALYCLFFIYPFVRGVGISFTNWDGLTQKSPISMEKSEFEAKILNNLKSTSDRNYLLSIYTLEDDRYSRESIQGLTRTRVDAILSKAGYVNPKYKSVGLANYQKIFSGKADSTFYPRFYDKTFYNSKSDLPASFDKGDYEAHFLSKLTPDEKAAAASYYSLQDGSYVLSEDKRSNLYKERIRTAVPEVQKAAPRDVEDFIGKVEAAGLAQDRPQADAALSAFFSANKVAAGAQASISDSAARLYDLGSFRLLLGQRFIQRRFEMGVVGFTVFFTVMTVILGNLLAFFIALALDTKIRTKNVLRSVFFLPNVLSMIVVALIWSIMFGYLLPKVTGIQAWMSDLDKAPWLIVLVAIWQASGYYMVIYLAGLQNIPTEIMEAATIDGANWGSRLKNIILPMLMPAFTICFFLSTANALKTFDLMYALAAGSGKALGTVNLVMDIYWDAYQKHESGLAAAKAVVLFGVIFAVTGFQLRVMNKKEVEL